MAYTGGVIKNGEPVSVADVMQALGVNDSREGYLCSNSHGNTNPWSLFKPIKNPSLAAINKFQTVARRAIWASVNYGLKAPDGVSNTDPANAAWRQKKWAYDPPTGGAASPFRISDFEGYDVNAIAPVSTPGPLLFTALDTSITVRFMQTNLQTTGAVQLSVMAAVKDQYPCIVIYGTYNGVADSFMGSVTGDKKFGEAGGGEVVIPREKITNLSFTDLKYKMCACNTKHTFSTTRKGTYTILPSETVLEDTITRAANINTTLVPTYKGVMSPTGEPANGTVKMYHPDQFMHLQAMTTIGQTAPGGTYLGVGAAANVLVMLEITNSGTKAYTLTPTMFKFRVANTLAGESMSAYQVLNGGLYTVAGTPTEAGANVTLSKVGSNGLPIAAGATVKVGLYIAGLAKMDSKGTFFGNPVIDYTQLQLSIGLGAGAVDNYSNMLLINVTRTGTVNTRITV